MSSLKSRRLFEVLLAWRGAACKLHWPTAADSRHVNNGKKGKKGRAGAATGGETSVGETEASELGEDLPYIEWDVAEIPEGANDEE